MDSDHDNETTPLRHWVKDYDSWLAEAVGIELKATLKMRKLLILLNEKNAKNTEFTRVRYTAGTRDLAQCGDRLEKTSPTTPFLVRDGHFCQALRFEIACLFCVK